MKYTVFIIAVLIILTACAKTPSNTPDQPPQAVPTNNEEVPDYSPDVINQYVACEDYNQFYCEVPDVVCESGDHSCRSPAFMTIATKQECQMLADWEPGVDILLFLRNREESLLGYFRIDKHGIMRGSLQPHLEEPTYVDIINTSIDDGWIFSGDCDMHVISSSEGFYEVQWRGDTL